MSAESGELAEAAARERWRRVRAIFDLAADEPAERSEAIVASEAGEDDALRIEVLRLLAAFRGDAMRLDDARLEVGGPDESAERIGSTVARYRLARLLGQGGMGAVYEGIRTDGAFEHRVAIKLIRTPEGGRDIAARFRRERQILAALEHRNIARLLDGGTTERGEPFFVMEYVEGSPITTYCQTSRLTVEQRLRLFRQVFAAVEHAHGKLIVHRDLKPANILVGNDGSVKLLDFGVAKLLGAQDGDELTTIGHARLFTPEYASPEQLRDEPISAASDVYALGVVLFEVLAGRRPYDVASRSPIAALRAAEADEVRLTAVGGEVDEILRKAMRADPAVRYHSVEQFDGDVGRYLAGLPISARPDTLGYRTGKFVRRHMAGLTAAVAISVALMTAAIFLLLQARGASEAKSWESAVDVAAGLQEIAAMKTGNAGLLESDALLREANTLCRTQPIRADQSPTCVLVMHDLGVVDFWRGDLPAADSLVRHVLVIARQSPGIRPLILAGIAADLALVRDEAGDYAEAEQLYRESSDLFARDGADPSVRRSAMLGWFALCLERQGRLSEADSLVQIELPHSRGFDHGVVLMHLAWIHAQQQRMDLARDEARRARVLAGGVVADTGALLYVKFTGIIGALQLKFGDVDGAIAQLREVMTVASRRYAADDPRLAEVQQALGDAWLAKQRTDSAVPLLAAASSTFQHRFGPTHPQSIAALHDLERARR
ncbi:MAG: serine/threonine-protein kinase [Gemmatimonadales bacterium]